MSSRVIVLSKRPAYLKKEVIIKFPEEYNSPLKCRDHPNFRLYFNEIWKELDLNDDGK